MTEIENIELVHLLSGEDFFIHLFLKGGGRCEKLPVEIEAKEDGLKVYHRRKLYMQIFYGLIDNLQFESISFNMRIVRFRYRNLAVGLQMVLR